MPLTPEQSRLVEDHMGIVPTLVRTHTPPAPWTREDLMSAGYEALCKAAQRWSPREGCTFGTYAYRRVQGAFLDELRSIKLGSRNMKAAQTSEMTEVHEPTWNDDHSEFEVRRFIDRLSTRERMVIELRMEGMQSSEIATKLGVSPSRISQLVNDVYLQMKGLKAA
jgi:RNA polymerase sigma factor (sigma-70 family)